MTFRESLEEQLRLAVERLIIVDPSEHLEYLEQVATLASSLEREKRGEKQIRETRDEMVDRLSKQWLKERA